MLKEIFTTEENFIMELVLQIGYKEICISGNQVGFFELQGLERSMTKLVTARTCYTAEAMCLEIHHECVGEIELLVKELSSKDGSAITTVSVECSDDYGIRCNVYGAYLENCHCRVNSYGDLRIILGNSNWFTMDSFEASPSIYFDYDDYSKKGVIAKCSEINAKNYKYLTYKQMRECASIIRAIQMYAGIDTAMEQNYCDERLVLYLSILDEYIKYKEGKHISISKYTFYDEDERRWKNMRIDNLLRWYPNADPTRASYIGEIQFICEKLQYKTKEELAVVRYNLAMSNYDRRAGISSLLGE